MKKTQKQPTKAKRSIKVRDLAPKQDPAGGSELYEWHEDFVIKGNCGQDKDQTTLTLKR